MKSNSHKKAIFAKANLTIEESVVSKNNEDGANELYIGKLVQTAHFLSRNNLAVKSLYTKFFEKSNKLGDLNRRGEVAFGVGTLEKINKRGEGVVEGTNKVAINS